MVGWIILTTDNLRWTSKHAAYLGQLLSVEIQARVCPLREDYAKRQACKDVVVMS
jgi:hypothetical protein